MTRPLSPAAPFRDPAIASPAMAQYLELKAEHPHALLFYRMGDFYEMFFEDAVAASAALDIALTKRGKHGEEDIAMCGVPVVQAERYLLELTRKGFVVAVCEQMEDPAEAKKRGAKSVVRREVVRVVTPGTITEDALLEARASNHLAAYAETGAGAALAWMDISAGAPLARPTRRQRLGADLARIAPREILIPERLLDDAALMELLTETGARVAPLGPASFEPGSAERRLKELYGVTTLEGFGAFAQPEISALGALADYLAITQKGRAPVLAPPRREAENAAMRLDAATRRNLEILTNLSGQRAGGLLDAVDRSRTGAGGRLLAERLAAPLTDPEAISARLDAVSAFVENDALRGEIRNYLGAAPDMARALARLSLERGGPRDLAALRDGLEAAAVLADALSFSDPPAEIARARAALTDHEALAELLKGALGPDLPLAARDGGFVAAHWRPELDQLRRLAEDARGVMRDLEGKLKAETGVSSLKIKYNGVLGYHVEVTSAHAERFLKPPLAERFIHRQTTANASRFTTTELADLDSKISRAGAEAVAMELAIFAELSAAVLAEAPRISAAAAALAEIDVASGLAELARAEGWTRPLVEDSDAFEIEAGRHPVVDQALRRENVPFVANSCDLSADRLWLVLGPNMAGKSTFLRQNALIALLAQAGSYVPAASARIGAVDQLFSRIGAADDLARGRSTFMVEMVETAAILNQAGPKALVILDEIGRGTATFDGLSIAWATVEHLHAVNRCRALFATHYHELAALAKKLEGAKTVSLKVSEWKGDLVFLHEVAEGAKGRSYGVQVARKAGLPAAALSRAEEVLAALEKGDGEGAKRRLKALAEDLPLFVAAETARPRTSAVEEALKALDVDALSPREALDQLYLLKSLLN
ncbi:DNA mismatch repair protein MutS [Neomegalonema perideroedes]|uniref:DNA mismatch repair protein MutS n=1 Tax=Neomegalonema perideroedes TaxID=217219 RepID=UPI00037B1FE6|nr:DNA mismatch repair protein MutS [Neomegalonema perideroedes]